MFLVGARKANPKGMCQILEKPLKDSKIERCDFTLSLISEASIHTMNFTSFQPFPVHEGPHLGQAIVHHRANAAVTDSFNRRFHQIFIIQSDAKIYLDIFRYESYEPYQPVSIIADQTPKFPEVAAEAMPAWKGGLLTLSPFQPVAATESSGAFGLVHSDSRGRCLLRPKTSGKSKSSTNWCAISIFSGRWIRYDKINNAITHYMVVTHCGYLERCFWESKAP